MGYDDEEQKNSQIRENNLEGLPTCLWVDDLRDPPHGWAWAKTFAEACISLDRGGWDTVSLDHDLADFHNSTMNHGSEIDYENTGGRKEKTGYHVALYMVEHSIWPRLVRVHTMNPVGGSNIMQLLQSHHPLGAGAVIRTSP